jgi:hypothetical protein
MHTGVTTDAHGGRWGVAGVITLVTERCEESMTTHGGKEECRWMYRDKRGVTGMTSDDSRRRRYWSDTARR